MTNTTNGFLPKGYTPKVSDFIRLGEGDNKVRILSTPLIGKLWWVSEDGVVREKGMGMKGDKPYRIRFSDELPEDILDLQTKEFWMLKVYDYKASAVRILEITQQSIIKALNEFITSDGWGDPRGYDINIKKEGNGKETKYYVIPMPPKDITDEIAEMSKNSRVDLESFLTGNSKKEDPFEGMEDVVSPEAVEDDGEDLPF